MIVNLIDADQFCNFIYWDEKKKEYNMIYCSVIEYLHCYCDVSQLDIYKLEKNYENRK